jgi:alanyl-tRNA synthetase
MADRGSLGGVPIADVQLDADGVVHHVVEGALPAVGTDVRCVVDEARRREHMALHTGQHCLSRALLDALGAVTVSSRLGDSACTIDVDRDGIAMTALAEVEARVNALVDADRPVRQIFPTDAELAALDLRKPPPETDRVRVVVVEGFDVTPCGGTHCTHTAQIELVWIEKVERYKGGSRVTFSSGPRARTKLMAHLAVLRGAADGLSCAPLEVAGVVGSLQGKLDDARRAAGAIRKQLATAWAETLAPRARGSTLCAVLDDADAELVRAIATPLATGDRLVALAARSPDGLDVVITRGPDSTIACGALLTAIAKREGGRGGGRPDHAQGRLPSSTDFERAVADALASADRA